MTGQQLIGTPTIAGKGMAIWTDALQRHVQVLGATDPAARLSGATAGYQGAATGAFNNAGTYLTCTAAGQYAEWDLGLMETNTTWDIYVAAYGGPNRGIMRLSINGVNWATNLDCYHTSLGQGLVGLTTWTPPANVGRLRKTLRVESVGKNASSTGYNIQFAVIELSRQPNVSTIAL